MPIYLVNKDRGSGAAIVGSDYADANALIHYRTRGSKNGVRNWQNEDGSYKPGGYQHYAEMYGWGKRADKKAENFKSPEELSSFLKQVKYKDFDRLMTPDEVRSSKQGSCHDQVMFELKSLRDAGYDPKALFVMEHSGDQGGMTHSLVYYEDKGKINWLENAWSERAGIKQYNSVDDIKKAIRQAHKSGEFGDRSSYKSLSFADFNENDQVFGETLQDLVDRVKWN